MNVFLFSLLVNAYLTIFNIQVGSPPTVLFTFNLVSNAIISVNRNSVCSNFSFCFIFCQPYVAFIWNCCNPKMMNWNSIGPHDAQFCSWAEREKKNHCLKWKSLYEVNNRNWEFMLFWKVCVALWLPMNGNWIFFFLFECNDSLESAIKTSCRPGLESEWVYWKQKKRFWNFNEITNYKTIQAKEFFSSNDENVMGTLPFWKPRKDLKEMKSVK